MKAEEILKKLVTNKSLVMYHNDWGYYIKTSFESIHMIGLIDTKDGFDLCLYYGDSQSQSRAFYSKSIDLKSIDSNEWNVRSNFHFSSTFRNLIWFDSDLKNEDYISFWKKNKNLLHQHKIEEVPKLIELLSNEKVIKVNHKELQSKIYQKEYTRLNICAGFALTYKITFFKHDELVKNGQLTGFLINKINEGLKLIGENGSSFFNDPPGPKF